MKSWAECIYPAFIHHAQMLDANAELFLTERYQVQQILGKSSGRQTLLAIDLKTQITVVIKLLIFNSDFDWDSLKLFEREAEVLQSLDHALIPRYLDHFEVELKTGKGFALVQSYIPAKSLEDAVKSGRTFSEIELKQLAKNLLEILIYLHQRQPSVIHRDIKPSNILLGDRSGNSIGQVYLVDFGSVQTLAAKENGTITVVGTYGYMPPEQFGGRAFPASDLYSLGATLIYLATGQHPAELPQINLKIQFQPIVNLNDSFIDWLKWMTEPSLDKRLSSAKEALQLLELSSRSRTHKMLSIKGRPYGSRIVVTKGADSLSIETHSMEVGPSRPFTLRSRFLFVCLLLLLSCAVYMTINAMTSAISFPVNYPFWKLRVLGDILLWLLVYLPFAVSLLVMILPLIRRNKLYLLLRRTRLVINQKISLISELGGLKYQHLKPLPREDVLLLQRFNKEEPIGLLGRLKIYPQLVLWVGTKKIEIGGNGLLTEPEIEWLAQELSKWLDLPIIRG